MRKASELFALPVAVMVTVVQLFAEPSAIAAGDKFGVALVPKMTGGDTTETQIFEIAGEMPEVDQVFAINTGAEMLKTLAKLKKLGRPVNYLVIAAHGSRERPGLIWGAPKNAQGDTPLEAQMIPQELDLAYNKQQVENAEKQLKNPGKSRVPPAEWQKHLQEHKQQVDLLEQAHGLMAENGVVLLVNCSAAATPEGRKYVQDLGKLLLGVNGGSIIASRNDIKINLRSSIAQRAWTQILNGDAFQHPEYLVKADWELFPIQGASKKTLTGRWGFGNQYVKAPNLQKFTITQNGTAVDLVKPGQSGNDMKFKGTLAGKSIQGRWDYRPANDWQGPFELTIDDDDHIHGWMQMDTEKGAKVKRQKDEFFLVRQKN